MAQAFIEAEVAAERGEVPIGAVIVHCTEIIARGGNRTRELNDVTAHAEILTIREASTKFGHERLIGLDLYVTIEPCTMCAAAISFARLRRLYFGATDDKGGAVVSGVRFYSSPTCHHAPDVCAGIGGVRASEMLRSFFKDRRHVL